MRRKRTNVLRHAPRYSLFATSYSPLFLLMVLKQVSDNSQYLHWGGISIASFAIWLSRFGLSSILLFVGITGATGLLIFVYRMKRATKSNGVLAIVVDIRNKNSEAISYIGTYIIPFLFQDYTQLYDTLSIGILLIVIYFIYVNSSLILINPVLNLRYSLYEVDFDDTLANPPASQPKLKSGTVIIRERFLEEGDKILLRKIGQKLYFAVNGEQATT